MLKNSLLQWEKVSGALAKRFISACGNRARRMRCQPSTKLYYFKEQYDHSSSVNRGRLQATVYTLTRPRLTPSPAGEGYLNVHSPIEISIFLIDYNGTSRRRPLPVNFKFMLTRREHLDAPATNGLIKTKPDNCRGRRPRRPEMNGKDKPHLYNKGDGDL